jgi:hypothetical protein
MFPFRTTTAQRHDAVYFCTTKGTKATKGAFQNSCQPSAVSYPPEAVDHPSKRASIQSILFIPSKHVSFSHHDGTTARRGVFLHHEGHEGHEGCVFK